MNAHVTISADRTLLPRALIKRPLTTATPPNFQNETYVPSSDLPPPIKVKRFRFRIGSYVRFHDFIARITGRSATSAGKQVYVIEIVGEAYGRPQRCALGHYLTRYVPTPPQPAA